MKMIFNQRKKVRLVALSLLLLIGVASIFLPHGLASYSSQRTYYDSADRSTDGGGPTHEQRAKAFTNGTMFLEVASGGWAWADAKGWVIWNFQPPYTLNNAVVSADFKAYGGLGTWFASAELYFTLEVNGKSAQYYKWYGNYWSGGITETSTQSINFGTMNPGTMYTIKATIRIHCENSAFFDLESYGPRPIGGNNYEGYGRVLKMVVTAP